MRRLIVRLLLPIVIVLVGGDRLHAAWQFSITDLGFTSNRGSGPYINQNRQVVGNNASSNGVLWENGVLTLLPTLPGTTANIPTGINDSGQIVGYALNSPTTALIWENGTVKEFLPGVNATPSAINNAGTVVGHYQNGSVSTEAFLWDNGAFTGLGTMGGNASVPVAINNSGQVIGQIPDLDQWFLLDTGTVTVFDEPGHGVNDINDAGQVVGQASISGVPGSGQAHLWFNGETTLLGTLNPNDQSVAWAINNSGLIVGESYGSFSKSAVLWENDELFDLNDLLLDTRWLLETAEDINDEGYIVGTGINPNGERTTYLLTPTGDGGGGNNAVPAPSSLVCLVGIGVTFGGMEWWRKRRRRVRTTA